MQTTFVVAAIELAELSTEPVEFCNVLGPVHAVARALLGGRWCHGRVTSSTTRVSVGVARRTSGRVRRLGCAAQLSEVRAHVGAVVQDATPSLEGARPG